MTLKKQLLVVGALTLLIPLAGIQFVFQLEAALRNEELARLADQARRIVRALEQASIASANLARPVDTAPSADARTLFVESFQRRLILDGYGDDWPNRPGENGVPLLYPAGEHLAWRAAQDSENLWLFVEIQGLTPVFGNDGRVQVSRPRPANLKAQDRLILSWNKPGMPLQEYVIEARAPGQVQVRPYASPRAEFDSGKADPGKADPGTGSLGNAGPDNASATIDGMWQTQPNGSTVELRLPRLPPGSHFGFSLEHATDSGPAATYGSLGRAPASQTQPDANPAAKTVQGGDLAELNGERNGERHGLPRLVIDRPALDARLEPFLTPGQSLTLVSHDGWTLARAEAPLPPDETDISRFSPVELLQQAILQGLRLLLRANQDAGPALAVHGAQWQGEPLKQAQAQAYKSPETYTATTHQPGEPPALTVIAEAKPGEPWAYLISQRSTEALLSLSSTTLGQVLSRSLLLTLVLVLILVGYASWLSWRISRLRHSVSTVVDAEGRVNGALQPSPARDELGELSRHFARLVGQVRGYTLYLESFARKLSHELKTPLAVMRSSLDNLQHSDPTPAQTAYIDRACDGAERLSRILAAMSEATRLERSLTRTEKETFDLAAVLRMATEGYRGLDPRVQYRGPEGPCLMLGAPDLLIQALDKLLENARDFTPADGAITISLASGERHWLLRVDNEGPSLPAGMSDHIFDSFISVRQQGAETGHLGQGLVIVKLVADFHHARVHAENRAGGVSFILRLPHHPTQPPSVV